ncbi:MAG: UbiA family prenyltransferase, partial [Rhodothermaceae bacterium]|nr:UbiA family prenyltransferase [Rhodothermaceae bacterium]
TAVGGVAFAILFLWQLPHFYALAWRLRDDYARGGFAMLPSVDPTGHSTSRMALGATLLLLVVGLLPTALGAAGWLYFVGMAALGMAFTIPAFSFAAEPSDPRARRLLLGSIFYLPIFFVLLVLDYAMR